ncbi:MAG: hypothetical protein MJZ22_03565 [Candidatus Saccharibacteria bacterium]|nr:hypothetical protein [Candidatus Saccharibacteria bacterium]
MNVLIWGASSFLGYSLEAALNGLHNEKTPFEGIRIGEVYSCDSTTPKGELDQACANADFVFNVSHESKDEILVDALARLKKTCPVLMEKTFEGKDHFQKYGKSKGINIVENSPDFEAGNFSVDSQVCNMIFALKS